MHYKQRTSETAASKTNRKTQTAADQQTVLPYSSQPRTRTRPRSSQKSIQATKQAVENAAEQPNKREHANDQQKEHKQHVPD